MNKSNKIFLIAVVVGVLAIGLAIGWFASSRPKQEESRAIGTNLMASSQPQTTEPVKARPEPTPSPAGAAPKSSRPQAKPRETNAQPVPKTSAATASSPTNGIPDWEDRVENILVADTEDTDKVKKMAEMFPLLSADGQEEVAHHLSNLTSDEDYSPLAQFLTNSTLSSDVLDVFYEDLLNRPNALKLPLLLQVAENPQHPNAQDAHDVLELFLEEDYGSDWPKWQTAMQQWLKDNPD